MSPFREREHEREHLPLTNTRQSSPKPTPSSLTHARTHSLNKSSITHLSFIPFKIKTKVHFLLSGVVPVRRTLSAGTLLMKSRSESLFSPVAGFFVSPTVFSGVIGRPEFGVVLLPCLSAASKRGLVNRGDSRSKLFAATDARGLA